MIDSNFLAVVAVAASMKTVAASCHHRQLGLAFGIEVQQLEQRRQPAIAAAAVIDAVADAESFVALQLMTMRVDVAECPVVK